MKYLFKRLILTTCLSATLLAIIHTTLADGDERRWEDDDHAYDRARRAVDRGEILPIAEILNRLNAQIQGEVIGVELEHEYGYWVYEFKIIDTNGRLLEVYTDAQTGTVLSKEDG